MTPIVRMNKKRHPEKIAGARLLAISESDTHIRLTRKSWMIVAGLDPYRDSIAPTTDADIRRAIARAEICRSCEHAKKVTLTVNTRPVYGVKCGKCGCGNLSLINGKCPLNKWDQADAT